MSPTKQCTSKVLKNKSYVIVGFRYEKDSRDLSEKVLFHLRGFWMNMKKRKKKFEKLKLMNFRNRGITMDVGITNFSTETKRITLLDATWT
jgi:hypothetical protein